MNIKKVTALAVSVLLIGIVIVFYAFRSTNVMKMDSVAVNDIAQSLAEKWESLNTDDLPCTEYHLDYVVLDNSGRLIRATKGGLNETMNSAILNRDTIVDISRDGIVLGKLVLYNNTTELWKQYRNNLLTFCVCVLVLLILFCILYAVFIDRKIFRPFRELQEFAHHVAAGKLNFTLKMDKGNMFGAFTESFDLMRDELSKARESERAANESKKELVASLSHDIKTPVASIKAVSEIMAVKCQDESEKRQLAVINSKADQINMLITNMFNATLEELQRLSVTVTEQPSTQLYEMIKNADYNSSAIISPIEECIILADIQRLTQVVDNIISNSYKYAGTSISVSSAIKEQYLEVEFKDYRHGVSSDELPLLVHKFYRAKNADGKNGTGLGLYISKYLMEKMFGDISCKNQDDGFAVTIKLRIA
jgi:signal transduction histidine kinase